MTDRSSAILAAATSVAARLERTYRLEAGELLSVAWLGAVRAAAAWDGRGDLVAYVGWRVRGAVADAIRDGSITGESSRRGGRLGRVAFSSAALEGAAPSRACPVLARVEARDELRTPLRRVQPTADLSLLVAVAVEGRTFREVGAAMGVSAARASQRYARALARAGGRAACRRRGRGAAA